MVKIAVIDSGVNMDNLSKGVKIKKYYSVLLNKDYTKIRINSKKNKRCDNKHGTLVVNCIEKYSKDVDKEFYIYNIFNQKGEASGICAIAACRQIAELGQADIISMSLTFSSYWKEEFAKVLELLKHKGILLVASAHNVAEKESFPANMEGVLGVNGAYIKDGRNIGYTPKEIIQFTADKGYEFLLGKDGKYKVFYGNSKATAIITAILSEKLEFGGKKKTKEWLGQEHKLKANQIYSPNYEKIEVEKKNEIIKKYGFDLHENHEVEIPWSYENYKAMRKMLSEYGVEDISELNYFNFYSIGSLFRFLNLG